MECPYANSEMYCSGGTIDGESRCNTCPIYLDYLKVNYPNEE